MKPVLRLVRFDEESFFDETFESFDALLKEYDPAKVNWIDIDGLGDVGLLQAVAERFKLHPLALEDVLNTAQRPKIEAFEDHYFIASAMVYPDAEDELVFEQEIGRAHV